VNVGEGWGWSLEFLAWRVLLMTLVSPFLAIGFGVYANACCEGDLFLE
tara:strand:- start:1268 stop:1411 length:144 start_codon:yes stop_codon:yes gene_type:complete